MNIVFNNVKNFNIVPCSEKFFNSFLNFLIKKSENFEDECFELMMMTKHIITRSYKVY